MGLNVVRLGHAPRPTGHRDAGRVATRPGRRLRNHALAAMLCLALGGGCSSWSGVPDAVQFDVSISNLDWVEIAYLPAPGESLFRQPCRLSLMGSGEIEFRTGRSPRLWDAFSNAVEDPHWNDLYEDRRHIGQERMQALYQQLVDAGLFPRYSRHLMTLDGSGPGIRINAQIGRERTIRLTDDPRIVRVVEQTLRLFEETAELANRGERRR